MTRDEDFLSASSLTSRVVDNVEQTRRPTILTENGKAKAVLLDFDSYRELRQRAADSLAESIGLALVAGQDPQLLSKIEAGSVHPAMVAFGLLKDEPDFESLVKEARRPGRRGPKRPDLKL